MDTTNVPEKLRQDAVIRVINVVDSLYGGTASQLETELTGDGPAVINTAVIVELTHLGVSVLCEIITERILEVTGRTVSGWGSSSKVFSKAEQNRLNVAVEEPDNDWLGPVALNLADSVGHLHHLITGRGHRDGFV